MTLTFDEYMAGTSRETMLDEIYSLPDRHVAILAFQVKLWRKTISELKQVDNQSALSEWPLLAVTSEMGTWASRLLSNDNENIRAHAATVNAITMDVLFRIVDLENSVKETK